MIGQQTQPLEVRYHKLEIAYRWVLVLAILALVALTGLVIWTGVTQLGQPDGEQVAQDVTSAWTGADSTALEAAYADDAVLVSAGDATYTGLDEVKGLFDTMKAYDFTPEIIGPVLQSGLTVVMPIHMTWSDGSEAYVTTVLELNSEGLVVHHQDYGSQP